MNAKTILAFFVLACIVSCKKKDETKAPTSLYETQLFKDVQLAAVFKDSKTFVDLVPNQNVALLEETYLATKETEGFDLQQFVADNFTDRSMQSLKIQSDTTKTMYEHIEAMWDKLKRGPDTRIANASRIPLPHEYVVPGGRFQEIYYWDSYFTIEGLLAADRWNLAKGMVDNFAFLIDSIGFIPNGTRDYFETRSQPPFFSVMVDALSRDTENMELYYVAELKKEYDFFMEHDSTLPPLAADGHYVQLADGDFLNRYFDTGTTPRPEAYKEDLHLANGLPPNAQVQLYGDLRSAAESGWDFSSRWYGEPGNFQTTETTAIIPVDLNCLLYHLERSLMKAARQRKDKGAQQFYAKRSKNRMRAINDYLWDDDGGFYMDFNFKKQKHTGRLTLAGVFPLFFKLANRRQAERVKNIVVAQFLKDGGLVTTLEHSGQQWDAPNGWAPLQWVAVKGLLNYGYVEEAKDIMGRWLALNEKVYKDTGKMMEKYNVEDLSLLSGGGEYETQDGFGWTNGVALAFKQLLEEMNENQPK